MNIYYKKRKGSWGWEGGGRGVGRIRMVGSKRHKRMGWIRRAYMSSHANMFRE